MAWRFASNYKPPSSLATKIYTYLVFYDPNLNWRATEPIKYITLVRLFIKSYTFMGVIAEYLAISKIYSCNNGYAASQVGGYGAMP